MDEFSIAYKNLNEEQKRAVDTIDGPVMVIAGPGTGKTQVLAVRIANILNSDTQTKPEEILCLTFTNAGVKTMRQRLLRMIGPTASRVTITTFHSFAMSQIEKFYPVLGFDTVPTLLDAASSVVLFDELLNVQEWRYVPRTNKGKYVNDIQSLISDLKRERISPEDLRNSLKKEIESLQTNPDSISSRGESKGQLKKEVEKKIESLERSREVADFYEAYEALRKERNVVDYNDILDLLVQIVEQSDEARDTMRENFQYILVDEHQDSSGIQNKFLETVWQETEKPNIFVVGDDRQLIYGFGGASLDYFKKFKHAFGNAALITLTQNYRSSQTILNAAEELLQSQLAQGKLVGNTRSAHQLKLVEGDYPRDEIIAAGLSFRKLNEENDIAYDHCAILVPKNRQVKAAMQVLIDIGLPVAAATSLRLFELADTQALLTVLRLVAHPFDTVSLSRTILDPIAGIEPMDAHQFLFERDPKKCTIANLLEDRNYGIQQWGEKLQSWITLAQQHDAYHMVQLIADDCLLGRSTEDPIIRRRIEIIRTLLHLALMQAERGERADLPAFVSFIDRMQEYNEDVSLAVFGADKGIKVLTLHGSKGLEFDAVWIAHMDEKSLMSSKRKTFTLPESIEEKIEERDEEVKKRQLYVAITRAKQFCTISYSAHSYAGADQQLAAIIAELPPAIFDKQTVSETEDTILQSDQRLYITSQAVPELYSMTELVAQEYENRKISVTMLNNFFECPWKWYFRSLLQLPEPMNDALNVGNIVHKNIEALLKGKKFDLEECALIQARYNAADAKRFASQAKGIVKHWTEQYLPHVIEPFLTEKGYPYIDSEFPHLSVFGKIDLIEDIANNEVRVTDWKTGGAKTGSEIDKRDEEGRMSSLLRQLAMYSYLIQGFSRNMTDVIESRLIFLETKKGDKNAVYSRRINNEEIALLRKDINDYDTAVKTGQWIHRPCHSKSYGQDTECEYCTMAKRYSLKAD
jgi:DNA helicase-2/ATP-dependent DNA helicase PcrA